MKVIYGISNFKKVFKNTVLAIGVFDGLHLGHQELIKKAVSRAKEINGSAVVMTFSPHPVHVLRPQIDLPLICSLKHRLYLLEQAGVRATLVVNFTKPFSKLAPQVFLKRYLANKIRPKEVFVGDDFRFGQDRSGTLELFKEAGAKYGFSVNILDQVKGGVKKISSTRIRALILEGKLKEASKYLGHPFSIMGEVVKGDGRGNKLGFPTVNLKPRKELIPPVGVYAVKVFIKDKIYYGMANVGCRPSFKTSHAVNIEVHLFDFKKNIYGTDIRVEFVQKIRPEKKFASKEALVDQLKSDEIKSRQILSL